MRAVRLLRILTMMAVLLGGLVWSSAAMATTHDAYEADNSAAAAKTIAFGTTQQRSTYPAGDVDWIKFNATAGTMYRIETTRANILPDVFTDLELYAPNGTTLIASDYEGSGKYWFSRLVWTAPSTGTYYLKVTGPPLMEGNYALQVLGTTGLRYVRGTVTADNGGAPIEGIVVGASTAGGDLLGQSVTAADGTYAIPLFYDDAYGISFNDPTRTYKNEWYDNVFHPSDLKLVAVRAAGLSGIDAGLTEGAVVSGVVTDESTGLPLSGITVYLIPEDFGFWTMKATTAADGSYRFSALAPRRYSVAFVDPAERYRSEHHDGLYWSGYFESGAFDDATWVDLAQDGIATLDASLLEKPTLSGRVTAPDGSPLAGRSVTVRLVTPSELHYRWVETTTDSNGEWTAGVDGPGPFWVKVTDNSGTYVSEYYDDVVFTEPLSATPVVIADYGVHISGIDSQLALAGNVVQGYVEHSGVAVPEVFVRVWEKMTDGWRLVPQTTGQVTDYKGYYSIGGLPVGMTACLEFLSRDTLTDYSGNSPSLDLATTFVVGPDSRWENVPDIHFDPYRAAGSDRYKTAVAASLLTYPSERTKTVVIASGTGFADALSASALAGAVDGPVLLASRYDVPQVVLEELQRLGATKAYVVGGTSALDDFVLRAIKTVPGMAYPTRIAGSDRYETSARVAETVASLDGTAFSRGAFVARGDTYPDALAAGPFAYSQGMPVLLTRPTALPTSVAAAIESLDITSTVICGDVTAVSAGVEHAVKSLNSGATTTVRRGGSTRYDTSAMIARYGLQQGWCSGSRRWSNVPWITSGPYVPFGYAIGTNFPDALSGASTLGARNGCLMLVTPSMLPGSVREVIDEYKFDGPSTIILGDSGVVGEPVLQAIQDALVVPPE